MSWGLHTFSYVQDHRSDNMKILFLAAYCCYSCSDVDKFISLRSASPGRPCLGPEPAVGGPTKKESLFLSQMLQYISAW
jgi:hypothetical protein